MKASEYFAFPALAGTTAAGLGFGRSGRAATDFLLSRGAAVHVYDAYPVPEGERARYGLYGVTFTAGFPTAFRESLLVRSPAIRPDIAPIRRALAAGSVLTGEVDLFMRCATVPVIGVTGSDGKTTTAAMIAALLRAAGKRVISGGNNGTPLLPQLNAPADFAVVELSSFQLMTAPAPDVAVLTNLTPNHLNWHADYSEYAAAKCRVFAGAARLVTNVDCPATREIGRRAPLPVTWFTVESALPFAAKKGDFCLSVSGDTLTIDAETRRALPAFRDFALPGRHNRENFAAAVGAVAELVGDGAVLDTARDFCGVSHRLQTVATVDGVAFVDSSIDTSPTRTAAALAALAEKGAPKPLVIAGGRKKGISLAPLADALARGAKAAYLYGEAAGEIADLLGDRIPFAVFSPFAEAFSAAARAAKPGDTVLLSPGCTAFDQFRDFEERGEVFCRLARALAEERK